MSRNRYRAKSKRVQKLGRDGLVEQDKATGEERRASQRAADISFGPDRTPDQGLARPAPAKGKKRRQHPPSSAGHIGGAAGLSPGLRGADDIPAQPPPPVEDSGQSQKQRQRRRGQKLRQNMAASAVRNQPGEGRLNLEADAAPGLTLEPDRGHLRFEDDPAQDGVAAENGLSPPPSAGPDQKRRQRKQAEWFRQGTTPPVQTDTQDGGRLRFEGEATPTAPEHDTGQERPRLRFEDDEASTPDMDGEPAAHPPSRRQQRQYDRAERRVEQSGRRLERAQAQLPIKRRARLEQEYDADTGKVRRRLRFEEEVQPEQVSPSPPALAGRTLKTTAVMKLHGKFREVEHQNVAVEAAHKGEFAAERAAGRFLRWNKRRLRSKPYRAARRAERRLAQDRAELAWQNALRDHPELRRKSVLSKWMQKRKLRRKYAQAAREAQHTAQHTRQAATTVGKIARAVQQYAAAHKSALLIVAMLALVISFFSSGLASCTAMLSGGQASFLSAVYLANEQDICSAELYFTELETDLQLNISSTAASFPGYDEYRYSVGEISHNPYELMAYLATLYDPFTFEQVRPEIERLFAEKYQLTRTPITETKYDENDNPYEWTVLKTTLTVRRWADLMGETLTPGEQTDRYEGYMQTLGGRQAFANPFDFPWLGSVSSPYGWRVHPISGEKDLHRGVDIAAAQGTVIKAVQDGRVVSAGNAGSYGLCVVIEDEKGYQSRYAHCASLSVNAGQEVKRGDVIATMGSTGDSTGPHLHLEVMLNGEYLNPYYFVDTGGYTSALPGTPGGPEIPDNPGAAMGSDRFQAMLAVAEQYLGFPYVWGGATPATSFDCSGYVSWVINHSGWSYGRLGVMGLEDICTPVSAADAQPGDLIFFIGTYDAPYPNRPTHVGIYVGGGRMIHCGDPISYASINTPYWQSHFYSFGRLPTP
ncbi:MAG: peptidoglycan DD-metalloendopeptidase family protein [Lachnospiraceae bacterium]|nr:peptidoglycan DD-metalloendopeptidase family protein [Lachnospiraceae bacterium]